MLFPQHSEKNHFQQKKTFTFLTQHGAMCLFILGMLLAFHPTLLSGFKLLQGDTGDTRFIHYILEHDYQWLRQAPIHRELWRWPAFFPAPNTSASTDMLIGQLPFYGFWRLMGLDPTPAFISWMLTAATLNFFCFWIMLTGGFALSSVAGGIGAFLFAFGLPRISQIDHHQLQPHFYSVLACLCLFRIYKRMQPRLWILLLPLFIGGELYSSVYYGWFLVLFMGFFLLIAFSHSQLRPSMLGLLQKYWWTWIFSLILGTALLLPFFRHYLASHRQMGGWGYDSIFWLLPPIQSWLYSGPDSWIYHGEHSIKLFRMIPIEHEKRLNVGFFTWGMALCFFLRERRQAWMQTLILPFLFLGLAVTLFPGGFCLWKWAYRFIPGASAIRTICRIGIVFLFPIAIAIAFKFQELINKKKWRLVSFALLVILLEQSQTTKAFDWRKAEKEVQILAAAIPPQCPVFFYSLRPPERSPYPGWHLQLNAMWASMKTGIPTINGYTSKSPARWNLERIDPKNDREEAELKEHLNQWLAESQMRFPKECWIH